MCLDKIYISPNEYYKGRYYIAFYDATDEFVITVFNNVKQICVYKNRELNKDNINLTHVELYRALKKAECSTRMLDGSLMHIHLIDVKDININK